MAWFLKKKCPYEEQSIKLTGRLPDFRPASCSDCGYFINDECEFKKKSKEIFKSDSKPECGLPALTIASSIDKPKDIREQFTKSALKIAPFNSEEKQEFLIISRQYQKFWDESDEIYRKSIMDCLKEWQLFLELGYTPKEAQQKVLEWLNSPDN